MCFEIHRSKGVYDDSSLDNVLAWNLNCYGNLFNCSCPFRQWIFDIFSSTISAAYVLIFQSIKNKTYSSSMENIDVQFTDFSQNPSSNTQQAYQGPPNNNESSRAQQYYQDR